MASKQADQEIVVERVFDAAPETVFAAFTEREHVEQWWLPKGGKTLEWSSKPGGMWRYSQPGHGGGPMMPFRIKFIEVDKPAKLVYDYSADLEGAEAVRTNVSFEKQGGQTKVTLQLMFANAAEREKAVKYGAIVGAMQALEALAEHVENN
jgi:uncharacterized protein YndB with AHSA1/START domain